MPDNETERIKAIVYYNSLETCEYIGGYITRKSKISVRCLKHDLVFQTSYENIARTSRAHHICPKCKEDDLNAKKCKCTCAYCGKEYFLAASKAARNCFHFCSRECKDKAQRISSGSKFNELRPDFYGSGNSKYREIAFGNYDHKCSVCGWSEDSEVLEVHHIDENRNNNDISNLIILCPTCHRKLTTHKYVLKNRNKIIKL